MLGMTKLFHGRLFFMIILPEWKEWQKTLKSEKRSPPLTSENILASPETSDRGKRMSQLGLEPPRAWQEEEGKWVRSGETACLPWQVKLVTLEVTNPIVTGLATPWPPLQTGRGSCMDYEALEAETESRSGMETLKVSGSVPTKKSSRERRDHSLFLQELPQKN